MNFQPIFLGGLIAGTLDLTAACVYSWLRASVSPIRVFQFIASGVMGTDSFTGGAKTAVLGVALHFLIATVATAVFYFASRAWFFLIEHPIVAGLLYGIPVYAFMNFVVLPLSQIQQRPQPMSARIINLVILMFCIGLPIALIVRRFAR
ncbi:MAG TPA: hypothetical protein VJM50_20145 [Pyrinomonadaceae bacterium]|nr:hypothetical protein [Pyrinomonadaceae bacterium]